MIENPALGAGPHAQICAYYDETWLDYRLLWLNPRNRAVHFGYWDERTRGHAESLINMNRVLAERIGIRPGQRVLDAGCGVGGSAIWLAKEYGVQVVGINIVASQIHRARRYALEEGVADRVSFDQQDFTATTFPDASFDVIWALESVCHAGEKRRFLAEARRVLRRGGRLGIVEYMLTDKPRASNDEELLHSWLSGWAIPNLATCAEWVNWTKETEFKDTQSLDIMANVEPSLRRLYWMTRLCWTGALVLHALHLRSETQHGNIRGARDQYRAYQRRLWFEAVLTATAR
jgi:cyclopropane fatty-acyl-phospholipid synthase-like methyltransferase